MGIHLDKDDLLDLLAPASADAGSTSVENGYWYETRTLILDKTLEATVHLRRPVSGDYSESEIFDIEASRV